MPTSALTVIHKYIRREMFDLAQRLFRAGPADLPAVKAAFAEMSELLRGHAAVEEDKLVGLLAAAQPEIAQQMRRDHEHLDEELDRLQRAVEALDSGSHACVEALWQLQLDWNRYLGRYFAHLDDEERVWFAPLLDKLPPISSLAESAAAQGHEYRIAFMAKLWAVTTPQERGELEGWQCGEVATRKAAEASSPRSHVADPA